MGLSSVEFAASAEFFGAANRLEALMRRKEGRQGPDVAILHWEIGGWRWEIRFVT